MSAEVQLAFSLLYSPGPRLGVCDLFSVGLPSLIQNSSIGLWKGWGPEQGQCFPPPDLSSWGSSRDLPSSGVVGC